MQRVAISVGDDGFIIGRTDPHQVFEDLGHLLVHARGEPSPLYEPRSVGTQDDLGAYLRGVPLDDYRLTLPEELSTALCTWSLAQPSTDLVSPS